MYNLYELYNIKIIDLFRNGLSSLLMGWSELPLVRLTTYFDSKLELKLK